MKLYSILAAACIFCILIACNKKEKNLSRSELLTSGSWKLTGSESDNDGNGTYEADDYAGFLDCFKDNFATFKSNDQVDIDEGPTKCDPLDPQNETASWMLTNNDNNLVIDGDSYDILELTNSTFRFRENYAGGRSSRVTFTKR